MKKISLIIVLITILISFTGCIVDNDENQQLVDQLIESIENIPQVVTLSNEQLINDLNNQYTSLPDEYQKKVTNYGKLEQALNDIELLKNKQVYEEFALVVMELINTLPELENITINDKNNITNIRQQYEQLQDEAKEYVTNLSKLIDAETKISNLEHQQNDLEKAQIIIDMISNLPVSSILVLEDKEDVQLARQKYDALTENQKKYVTNLSKLEALETKILVLEQIQNDKEVANSVQTAISNLPDKDNLTYQDKEEVETARNSYDKLTDDQKSYVKNISKLLILEEKMVELVEEENNKNKAKVVEEAIAELPAVTELTLEDNDIVINVRNLYNNLTDIQKTYVTNLEKLLSLEEQLIVLSQIERDKKTAEVINQEILLLPSVNELVLEDKSKIETVRNAYNNLTEVQKGYVTNLGILIELETKINELEKNLVEYDVIFHLDGGILSGVESSTNNTTLQVLKNTFTINYYNTGYWTNYQTELVLFKVSNIGAEDMYTSALKIGFSLDENTNKYYVDQILEAGSNLTTELRISDYYLFVHSDNATTYSLISQLSLNDIIEINQNLDGNTSTQLNLTLKVYQETTKQEIVSKATYKGTTTLGTPLKSGYRFLGFYDNPECIGDVITFVNQSTTLYALWIEDSTQIVTQDILTIVSDVANSNTRDKLISENYEATFEWSSSNNNLYVIKDGYGTISKAYQTHKKQTITISVKITYEDGVTETKSKDIIVEPVLFDDFSSSPVATYFSTGAMYAYKGYCERYQKEGTIFSNSTKEVLDIVYYAFVNISANGTCTLADESYLDEVMELKNHNVRIVACVSGVSSTTSGYFSSITSDATLLATFINNLMNLVEKYNFDGLDIDWEATSDVKPNATGMNNLMKGLREEMTIRQDNGGTPYFLSAAVPASSYGTASDRFDFVTLNKYVDYINLMSYDMNKTTLTTHLSPLYKSTYDNGYGFGCNYGVERLVSLGLSKGKVIIGSAGYGKAYNVTGTLASTNHPYLGIAGTLTQIDNLSGSYSSGTLFGNAIVELIKTGKYTKYTEYNSDGKFVGTYLYNSIDKIFVTYDGEESITEKYKYALENNVGIMCWCYSEDTAEIYVNSIYEVMNQ